jgi:hypothetical protein
MGLRLVQSRWIRFALLAVVLEIVLCASIQSVTAFLDRLIGPHPQLSWPTAEGTISSVDLYCDTGRDEGRWTFRIGYTYSIESSQHSAEQKIDWAEATSGSALTEAQALFMARGCGNLFSPPEDAVILRAVREKSAYQRGRPAVVYYNPRDIDEAVLVPGMVGGVSNFTYGTWIAVVSVGSLPIVVLFALYTGISNVRRQESQER